MFSVLPVSFTNKADCHEITELLVKVMLNTINSQAEVSLN
jgi:hypothetical protein